MCVFNVYSHLKRLLDSFEEIKSLESIYLKDIFEGENFMIALTEENQVYGWGENDYGQLCLPISTEFFEPKRVSFFDDKHIIHISCGRKHCLALNDIGDIYAWGANNHNQVMKGGSPRICYPTLIQDIQYRSKFVYCYQNTSFSITIDGNVKFWGENLPYLPKVSLIIS